GSKVDLRKAGEGPEVGVREAVKPERIGIDRQAGHFRIVPGVLGEREQVAPDHAQPKAADSETKPLQRAAAEGIADVELLDLHVRTRLDEEVDRIDAIIDSLIVVGRLLAGAVRAVRVGDRKSTR